MDSQEFVRRIAQLLEITPGEAERYIKVIFSVLKSAISPGEIKDVLAQLPEDLAGMLAQA